jgi:HlyD family secretion protein
LEVPDLASRLAQKQAEAAEAQARLKLLEIGPRPEEIAEQRGRAVRAKVWRDLADKDLACLQQTFAEELVRLDKRIAQHRAELDAAKDCQERARQLRGAALAEETFRDSERKLRVCEALLGQAEAQKRIRQTKGLLEAQAELARRDKDWADAQALLRLLEAGTRPEEIAAERARLARAQEEVRYLEDVHHKLTIRSHGGGVVTTPRLKETVGQYCREGDLICVIEEPNSVEVEIAVAEEDVARVAPGQEIALKVRALPFETLSARVVRVAPAAAHGEVQANVTVYGRLEACPAELLPGMTGYARIYTGPTTPGNYLGARLLRYLRTEFWW